MKKISFLLLFLFLFIAKAQNYNPIVNYFLNGTPTNGIKIKTNIPYTNQSQMPTIIIEGYNYEDAKPINLSIVWYVYGGNFTNFAISTSSTYTPEVKLSNESGLVVIFINDRKYFNRFSVRGFATGLGEQPSWFSGWTIADEALSGSNTVIVPYKNINNLPSIVEKNGNVGIGTTNPQAKLDVNGGINISASMPLQLKGSDTSQGLRYKPYYGDGTTVLDGPFLYGYSGGSLGFKQDATETHVLNWNAAGNVGIGITSPTNKLDVNGTIHAKEVKVDLTGWPDFVFKKEYHLPSLEEVEKSILKYGYLPNMPSEKEILENGLNLGENQKLLLQKIEELTLYSIEQNKKNKELELRLENLEKLLSEKN